MSENENKKPVWTPHQEDCIDAHGGALLVSAAAGSGKTTVLIERILRLITDPAHPADVDRLLVVTFTRSAAAQMRRKLSGKLSALAQEHPDEPLFQRQLMLLPKASISTVDGFCADLLRRQAGQTDLPPRFRIAEDTETALFKAEALDTVLEEQYRLRQKAFLDLSAHLNDKRQDRGVREAILNAYHFMQAQPFPNKWLAAQIEPYTAVIPLEKTEWMKPLYQRISFSLDQALDCIRQAHTVTAQYGIDAYADTILSDLQHMERLTADYRGMTYDELRDAIVGFPWDKLPAYRSKDPVQVARKDQAKALRDAAKGAVSGLAKLLGNDEASCREELAVLAPMIVKLGELITRYDERFTALKRQKKLLDYSDLEHECLRLLLDGDGQPTPLARELSERYVEIMVDEYQDTNAVQDNLFRAISKQERNLFMVGDVKQSIYGFRMAMPSIFTERRDRYPLYNAETPVFPATITLENNFRSRSAVTDTVNFLFRQLMRRSLGGVEYDEHEALICSAVYPDLPCYETEWLLTDKTDGEWEDDTVTEARLIGGRIRQMLSSLPVQDKDGQRKLRYEDVCILLRSHKEESVFIRELERMGIPAAAGDRGEGILSRAEVMTAVSLLRVIDNPLREVELTGVMISPLYGFTPDDCARIRLDGGDMPLYAAIEAQAERREGELSARCGKLIADLRRARALAVSLPADRLLERLCRDLEIPAVFAAREDGRQRIANLRQLDRIARSFEQGEYRGLSAFVRYLDRLQETGGDLPAVCTAPPDCVRIMTIHASKGLEFPVVFLARLNHKFNTNDDRVRLLFHDKVGIGLRLKNPDKRSSLPFCAVSEAKRLDTRAEELRLWYVALTRAKEKLVMVVSSDDLRRRLEGLERQLRSDREIPPAVLLGASTPADWMLTAALRHPSFAAFRTDPESTCMLAAQEDFLVRVVSEPPAAQDAASAGAEEETTVTAPAADPALTDLLRERAAYRYPYTALACIPAKMAAAALSHRSMAAGSVGKKRPAFLQEGGMDAAQKGTAVHAFMQYADYPRAAADPAAEADRLTGRGFLSEDQRRVLALDKITGFFGSTLYARMAASPDCRREFPFTVEVPASMTTDLPLPDGDETVVVQGIADCVFREGDGLVLVDYKTDRGLTPDELADRYRSQMTFYKHALETVFRLPVRQTVLYSFALGQAVELSLT